MTEDERMDATIAKWDREHEIRLKAWEERLRRLYVSQKWDHLAAEGALDEDLVDMVYRGRREGKEI
jgi:hypothetical protein